LKTSRVDVIDIIELSKLYMDYIREKWSERRKMLIDRWVAEYYYLMYHFQNVLQVFRDTYVKRIVFETKEKNLLLYFLMGFRILMSMKPEFISFLRNIFHEKIYPMYKGHLSLKRTYSDYIFSEFYEALYDAYQLLHGTGKRLPAPELVDMNLIGLINEFLPDDIREIKKKYVFSPATIATKGFFSSLVTVGALFHLLVEYYVRDSFSWAYLLNVIDKYDRPADEQYTYLVFELIRIAKQEGFAFSKSSKHVSIESYVGRGKTTYALASLNIFFTLTGFKSATGLSEEDLGLIFRITDLETFYNLVMEVSKYGGSVRIPILILDDVSDWLSPYWAWSSSQTRMMYEKIRGTLIYGRSGIGLTLWVANSEDDIASFVRKLLEVRLTNIPFQYHGSLITLTGFKRVGKEEKRKRRFDPTEIVDVFVFPIMRLPQKIYELDLKWKSEMMRRRAEEAKSLKKEKKKK